MTEFESIRWVNFLSTGSGGNEIQLNKTRTTLITGKNGSGKSAGVTDALCFVLFNKPFRKSINRGQLINSINNKNCLVTTKFSNSGNKYVVSRGIKPGIFEIFENGVLLNQESSTRDYQRILEEQILKFNFKTFTQVVLLGSASFIPFMELPKASRREVIEDVLDIGVFSTMNEILKRELSLTKEQLISSENKILLAKERIESQKKLISVISESNESQINEEQEKIEILKKRNSELSLNVAIIKSQIASKEMGLSKFEEIPENRKKAGRILSKVNDAIERIEKEFEFFHDHEECPTCSQNITHEHKGKISSDLEIEKTKQLDKKEILEAAIKKLDISISEMEKIRSEINELNSKFNNIKYESDYNSNLISQSQKSIKQKQQKCNVDSEKQKLKQLAAEAIEITETRLNLLEEKKIQDQAVLLLKDNGIKTSIIKEYLPIINRQINKYLSSMDFFCNFEIDEEFNEIIKSRYRDTFSYGSFSQGQKQRIDIAIMYTFREIAKMKNSLNTNILVLDEIFSSSLDNTAVSFLVDMLNSMDGINVFVVTHHPDEFEESFDRHIQFKEVNNFSIMSEV